MAKVIVGLSGGVDSAVSAYLLQKQGHDVVALFMKNWDDDGLCPSEKDYQDVIAICNHLDIPYYTVNLTEDYKKRVFEPFLQACREGKTPNPDILCNSEIKFDLFLEKALQFGDFIATGHYCQIDPEKKYLLKGKDPNKDQSYFLHTISCDHFPKVLFPIGHLNKEEVRKIAKEAKIPVFAKKDSTGICFVGKRNFKDFVGSYLGFDHGPIRDRTTGQILGEHVGLAYYTIGQRKGLHIGGSGSAWFVAEKETRTNTLWVVQGEDHIALYKKALKTDSVHWLISEPSFPFRCCAKVRYRMKEKPCLITKDDTGYLITFDDPQRAITPGQSVVFYQDEKCLGGGVIS
jgi:tRNA-uridine 2-sulfurtransferase